MGVDVNTAVSNCMATPDKGAIVDLIGAVNATYPTLVDSLSLGSPPFSGVSMPLSPPTPPPSLASPPSNAVQPPSPVPAPSPNSPVIVPQPQQTPSSPSNAPAPSPNNPVQPAASPSAPNTGAQLQLPPYVQKIYVDMQSKCKNQSEMKAMLAQLGLDCHTNVISVCQKAKGNKKKETKEAACNLDIFKCPGFFSNFWQIFNG